MKEKLKQGWVWAKNRVAAEWRANPWRVVAVVEALVIGVLLKALL